MQLVGIHHVSALTANAAENVRFYTRTMGMRLVKKTVNQDDVTSYHLFYGDERGNPGTELTFFDIPHLAANRPGTHSISSIGLRVKERRALDYWRDRFDRLGVEHDGVVERAGRLTLAFRDFEGQRLVLTAEDGEAGVPGGTPWAKSPVPADVGIRGLGPVTITVPDAEPSVRVLTEVLGFRPAGRYPAPDDPRREVRVFATGTGGAGAEVHVEERPDLPPERLGRGGVHHVAFRVPNPEEHAAWLERLEGRGFRTSGIVERFYFRSIYFREPNGILYELATDGPGFEADEDFEHLGERLALPPFLEPYRAAIEARLRPLDTRALAGLEEG
ncbi:MAG: ring-cleaving dioxygenase [Clostridia bacterium]|nr:ring-cleaving dioxygenase [Clostridia bacterium]